MTLRVSFDRFSKNLLTYPRIKDEVCKAIGNKLNNFSKTFKGERIINNYLAEKFASQQHQVEANQQQIASGQFTIFQFKCN